MDAATFVAALLGPIYLAVALGMIIGPSHYAKMAEEFLRSPALLYLGGATALAVGISILLFHSGWPANWRLAVTLVGWIATIKGALLIVMPKHAYRLWMPLLARSDGLRVVGIVAAAIGIFFSLAGYTSAFG